jgi:hypothetical protein
MLAAGELISIDEIPDGCKEGQDCTLAWTPEERRELQEKENAAYLKQFQPEPLESYVTESYAPGYQSGRRIGK